MANPYHDGTGKFCSREEMQTAIDNYAVAGDIPNYFKLRKELETIEASKVVVSKELISRFARGYATLKSDDPEEITQIYSALQENLRSDDANVHTYLALIHNPNTPQEVKDGILANASPKLKQELASQFYQRSDETLPTDFSKLLEGETDPELLTYAMGSNKFTFEEQYHIAQRYERGLADLASSNKEIFFREPTLVEELKQKTRQLAKNEDPTVSAYYRALALAEDDESHEMVLRGAGMDATYNGPIMRLADNPNLSAINGGRLLAAVQWGNIRDFGSAQETVARNLYTRTKNDRYLDTYNPSSPPKPYKGSPAGKVAEDLQDLATLERGIKTGSLNHAETYRYESLRAISDSYEDNYTDLVVRYKMFSKRNAPQVDEQGETLKDVSTRLVLANKSLFASRYLPRFDRASSNSFRDN